RLDSAGVFSNCFAAVSLFPLPPSAPESREGRTVWRFTELLESALTDLPDTLARNAHQRANLFQRHRVRPLLETVIKVKDLSLARGEVLPKNAVDKLAHQVKVRHVFNIGSVHTGQAH